ncbi:MAG: tRNA glutamyl-Q(34) synthetase GluQRS, partial [Solirubrobacteraceae bacterium]
MSRRERFDKIAWMPAPHRHEPDVPGLECRLAPVAAAGRYAPSPSGELHLGNLRTALIAWVAARSRGARFALRIEDLDRERSHREHERSQLADLARLGLDWDGQVVRQSERLEQHREGFELLRAAGRVYPCWCTRADVREASCAPHGAAGPLSYPGTCRRLSEAERARRAKEARREPVWRLDGRGERVAFSDRLRGDCEMAVEDVVVWRASDEPAYNLAVVLDDDAQGVGEVVRGEDLIDATPAQVLLARVLDLREPTYLHVPLVLGPEGRRLAKRDGAVTLRERLAAGESIEEVVAWMAQSAGLASPAEATSLDALIAGFDPQKLAREPVVVPPEGSLDTGARGNR